MKGLFAWVGFRQTTLDYARDARFAGETKWNYWRLWNLALEGITSFSSAPLKMASYVGLAAAVYALGARASTCSARRCCSATRWPAIRR